MIAGEYRQTGAELEEVKAQPHAPGPQGKAAKQKKIDKLDKAIKTQLAKELGGVRMKQTFLVSCTNERCLQLLLMAADAAVTELSALAEAGHWYTLRGLVDQICWSICVRMSGHHNSPACVQTAGVLLLLFRMTPLGKFYT